MFVVELDLRHLKTAAPIWLVPQTILERTAGVLLSDEELYRLWVAKLGQRIQTHLLGPYSASHGEASVSDPRCDAGWLGKLSARVAQGFN